MFVIERLISVFAPHTCLSCGREGNVLCAWCLPDALLALPDRCYSCRQFSQDSQVCQKCCTKTRLDHVWVRSEYKDLARELLYTFKFNRGQAAAAPIAALIDQILPWLPPETVLVHVPTATVRRRQRGYDHAELLAKELARIRGLHHLALLARRGQTRQVGAKRDERLHQLAEAYRPLRGQLIKGANILLVDDITTTGATLAAAAKVLKRAGAKTVDAVVFAQKQ